MISIANNDIENQFKLVSNQSKVGLNMLENFNINPSKTNETILLIDGHFFYEKSKALTKILLALPKYRLVGKMLNLFPNKISDFFYGLFSKHRKKFIKNDCRMPNKHIREKFIL